jgi:hypothetical protein
LGSRSVAGGSIHAAGCPSSFATSWPAFTSSLRANLVAVKHGHGNGSIMVIDRGGVPDLSESGDSFNVVGDDPHDPTTTSETRSANAIAEPTPDGYRPCRRKISLITKINSCAQSKNEQESEASNLNITRK